MRRRHFGGSNPIEENVTVANFTLRKRTISGIGRPDAFSSFRRLYSSPRSSPHPALPQSCNAIWGVKRHLGSETRDRRQRCSPDPAGRAPVARSRRISRPRGSRLVRVRSSGSAVTLFGKGDIAARGCHGSRQRCAICLSGPGARQTAQRYDDQRLNEHRVLFPAPLSGPLPIPP